ncbi:MAG: hypothetical protein KF742_02525 [Cryobacterium sp.]|nr:hypothetical protein [Cryobacterium sp.]
MKPKKGLIEVVSQIGQVKQSVAAIAKQAKSSSNELGNFTRMFKQQVGDVNALIGQSSQSADQKVIAALNDASAAVEKAAQALQSAASTAESYANSI